MRAGPGRRGATLVELMVSLVILGIMGAALLRLFVSQSRFVDQAAKQRSARTVGRASLNFLMSEMRTVEATGGVVAASPASVTLRSPYALGMSCGTVGSVTSVSLLPTDSAEFSGAVFTGYAWRDGAGRVHLRRGRCHALRRARLRLRRRRHRHPPSRPHRRRLPAARAA